MKNSKEQSLKHWLKHIITKNVENFSLTEEDYAKDICPDYEHHVDYQTFNFKQWVSHIKAIQEQMQSLAVSFKHIIVEDNKIFSLHYVEGIKKNGEKIFIKMLAYFEVKDGKLSYCEELSQLVEGKTQDQSLASLAG